MSASKPIKVGIVGNISSGKSSLIQQMKSINDSYLYVAEPLKSFNTFYTVDNVELHPLELYYTWPNELSAQFQMHAIDCFDQMLNSKVDHEENHIVHVYDRIPHEIDIFTRSLYNLGQMHYFSYEYCRKKLKTLIDSCKFQLDHIYYVKTLPETCYQRLLSRNRSMEVLYRNMKQQLVTLDTEYDLVMSEPQKHFHCNVTISTAPDIYGRAVECLKLIDKLIQTDQRKYQSV